MTEKEGCNMAVTLQQIAEACGVSRGTVDRALRGREGVRPEVAERIKKKRARWVTSPVTAMS